MKIRPAKTNVDFAYVASLFNPKNNQYIWPKSQTTKQVKQNCSENKRYYILLVKDKPVGWFNIRLSDSKEATIGIIIDHPHQDQGFGKQAMALIRREAKKLGMKRLRLEVFLDNKPAINLYKKTGFKITANVVTMERKI
jgi:RimJ/RimL family protein N-acetyltransferase